MFEVLNKQGSEVYGNYFKRYNTDNFYTKLRLWDEVIKNNPYVPKIAGDKYTQKSPVVIFGCSFAAGDNVPFTQSFQYILSEYTHRKTYNYAVGGTGVQHIYWYLTHLNYIDYIANPDYVVYIYINDHIQRMYRYFYWNVFDTTENLRYKKVKDHLERVVPALKPLYSLYTVKAIQDLIVKIKIKNTQKCFNDFKFIIKKEYEIIKLIWPNTKFVILQYDYSLPVGDKDYIYSCDWSELEKEGIIIINTNDLVHHNFSDAEYRVADGFHPSGKAWQEVAPAFADKIMKIH